MKKSAGIVSLVCMIITSDCGAESNLNDGTLSNAQSGVQVKDLKESTEATSTSEEIRTNTVVPELLDINVLSQVKINNSELNLLAQNSQQASDIEAGSEMWKALSAENRENN